MSYESYLAHHGIKGMRWGIRRYQNPDGTLTAAGQKRAEKKEYKKLKKNYTKTKRKYYNTSIYSSSYGKRQKAFKAAEHDYIKAKAKKKGITMKQAQKGEDLKDLAKVGGVIAANVLYQYGAYKFRTDPKFRQKTAQVMVKGVQKGAKVATKLMDAYGQFKYNHDKNIVDAPGFEVMGEVREIAGYLKG